MYAVKYDNKIIIEEGTEEELAVKGYNLTYPTSGEAETAGKQAEYSALRKEFMNMSVQELESDRAKYIENKIYGMLEDYQPGEPIKRRKHKLMNSN